MSEILTGGCQCGRIRFQAEIEAFDAYLCHCRMCQRATGGVSIAFKNVPRAKQQWEQEPDRYASSPFANRLFCSVCGTPLGFEYGDSPNRDITVGSFDDPSRFFPTSNFGVESCHEAWSDTGSLPGQRCDDYAPLVERWEKSGEAMP